MSHLPNVSPEIVKAYQDEISKTASPATFKRKEVSLNRFFDWAKDQGHIPNNPFEASKPEPKIENPYVIAKPVKKTSAKTWATLSITTALIILLFLLAWKIKLPIDYVINLASESSPESAIQTVANNAPTANPTLIPTGAPTSTPNSITAVSASNGAWNLFAKLKLSEKDGAPRVGSQSVSFKLYKSEDGNEVLFSSPEQTITTDANGSALVSLDSVPSELFFQNNKLFLEPVIGSTPASVRIPVNTANVSTNLNGYLASNPYLGAEPNTVPIINSEGTLTLASESPAIKATSGNFLLEGQALTLKTADGTDGNIEINPDGLGYVHFLFEGNKGNFVNAQGPNLTSGSLYYGMVPNNSTGYDLINLQSGAPKMTTKFKVDALGNTMALGDVRVGDDLFVTGDVSTGGTQRLSSSGALDNITGYNQTSGNFTITQGAGDFGSIVKKPAEGGALNDLLTLTLDERGKPTTANSDYSTLVLNRYDGWNTAAALKVNTGNAIFNGQVQLGRYATNPSAIGAGSIIFNSTDGKIYYWDGSTWVNVATGTSSFSGAFTDLTSGTNTTASMVVGSGASLSFSGTGTITASDVTCVGCVANTELANSSITFTGDSGSSAVALGGTENILGTNGLSTSQSGNTLTITAANATTSTVGVASFDPNFFTVSSGNVSIANDSLDFPQFKDSLSIDAPTNIETNGLTLSTSGTGALNLASTGQVTFAGNVDATSGLDVTNANLTVGGANFSVVPATGNTTTAGDLAVNGGDITSTSGTFNLVNSGVTTLNVGGGATTIGIGAGTGNTTINNNLVVSGTTTLGGLTYTWPGSQASTYILQTDGAGTLSWVDPNAAASASIFWNQSQAALFPKNSGVDVLIGSSATESAKFAFKNVLTGIPTASISGTTANVATYLTGEGNLSTTNASDLTLGSATTGNVTINSRGLAALTANGADLTTVGTLTFPNTNTVTGVSNYLRHSQGISVGGADTFFFNSSGDINANVGTFTGDVAVNGGDITTSASSATLFNTNATTVSFAGAANTLNIGPIGAAGTVLLSGGSGDTGCTLDGVTGNFTCSGNVTSTATSGTQGWWQLTNKILSPANSTYDLSVGSNATGAAFQVFGVEKTTGDVAKINSSVITSGNVIEATTSAITSGNILKLGEAGPQNFTGNGILLDFDNSGGGSFTGNFIKFDNASATQFSVDSTGNVVAAGDIAVNGGDLTTSQTTANIFTNATTLGLGAGSGTTTVNNSLAVNGNTISTDETTFNLLNTTSTTINFAGAGTTINIGDVTGTTTFNNSIYTKGSTTLGDATSDAITFTARANSSLLPITNNNYDLGSLALQWNNIYGQNIYQNGNQVCDSTGTGCPASSAVNYWQLNSKVLSPANNTFDLAVGGTATSSSKFQAYALETTGGNIATINSNGITTGDVLSATASAITSGNLVKLGEGGDQNFSGNGIYADFDNTGGGSFTGNFLKFDNAGATKLTVAANGDLTTTGVINLPNSNTLTGVSGYLQNSAGFSVGGATTYHFDTSGNIVANDVAANGGNLTTTSTGTATLFNTNATTLNIGGVATTVSLGATTGTTTINNSLSILGDTTLGNSITDNITFNGRVAQDNDLLPITTTGTNDIGSALLPWDNIYANAFIQNGFNVCDSSGANCPSGAFLWQLNNKVISPANSTYDLTVGGTATGSAFQVFGIENVGGNIAKINSTVITTGNVFEATSSAITTGNLVKLGQGGDQNFSGNGIYLDFDNTGNGGNGFTGNFVKFDNAGATKFTVDASGNVVAAGNIAANGGSLTTTQNIANLFNTNATTLNIGGAATTVSIGNGTGTTTINNASTVAAGNLTVQGTTGITESGTGADITFSGSGTHSITNSNSASVFTIDSGNSANLQLNNSSTGDVEIAGGSGTTGCTIANATGNLTCSGDIAVNGGDLTTTQTTANLFTNASTLGIGAGSGTTTVNNSLAINGATLSTNQTTFNLINTTATTLNFAGAATTLNVGPTGGVGSVAISGGSTDTGCTLDGTTGNFTCSGNITSTSTTGSQGWWQLTNKILSPANSTYDLAVGSNATGAAFQVFGVENAAGDIAKINSTVITTGNVIEATASAITSGNLFKLGQGGDQNFSGNGIYLDFDNTGNGGNGFTGNFVKFDNAGLTKFTVDGSGNMIAAGDVAVNGGDLTTSQTTANLFTNATTLGLAGVSGTTTINNSLSILGDTTLGNAITDNITFNGRVAQDNDLLPITTTGTNDIGSALLPWDNIYAVSFNQNGNLVCDASGANCPAGAGYWAQALGALYPTNNTSDLLIGGDATTSAKFAFKNVLAGTPTASISGTTANVATFLTGEGNLATTSMSDLTLGGSTTGNVVINSRGSAALTANGANLTATGTVTLPNSNTLTGVSGYVQNSAGFSVGGGTTYRFDTSGNIVANDVAANGGNITTTAATANLLNANATLVNFAGAATTLNIGPTGAAGSIAMSGGSADTGCTLDGTTGNFTCSGNITSTATSGTQGWWQLTNKILSPANSTYDLSVGGSATGSAFQVFGIEKVGGDLAKLNSSVITTGNVLEATASAITSGNIVKLGQGGDQNFSGNGIFADFDNTGNGGNGFTGNFLKFNNANATKFTVDASGNTIAAGDLAVNGGDITSTGALNITPGGSLVAGVTGQSATFQGSTTSITSNGAGNDITLTSADQIILNAGGTIELQDNTNVTGNLDVSGTLTSGTADAFQVDASGNLTSTGTTGITLTGAGSDITFATGASDHDITASAGTLRLGAFTLLGTITGNNQDVTGIGNLTVNGSTTLGDAITDNITFTSRVAQDSDLLPITTTGTNDIGSGSLPWDNIYANAFIQNGFNVCDSSGANCPAGTGYWQQLLGTLYPTNNTTDLLIGGDATTSAKFAFKNVLTGVPTASISGTTANVATFLTGEGNLATTNMSDLTLGGSSTGNVVINSRGSAALTASGANLTATGTITLPNTNTITGVSGYVQNSAGFSVGGATTYHFDTSGNIVANDVAANGGNITTTAATANLLNTNATLINFAGAATTLNVGPTGASGTIAMSGGSADTGCTLDGTTGNFTCSGNITSTATSGTQGWWQLTNKILSPANSTYDLAVGSNATGAAFQVFGVENAAGDIAKINSTVITSGNVIEATASAITTGNLVKLGSGGDGHSFSGNGIFMDFDNAGGGNFTGNFLRFDNSQATVFTVNSAGNVVTSGDIAVNGGDITSSGALNITPGGTLTAGATGQATVLQGSTTSLTSNGAGNDITLTSADQIILNAGSTIELQDNTNATGNLDVSGTLTSGTADAFQIDASGNISTTGTTGLTLTGAGSDITFATGVGSHTISASAGTLELGAHTLVGAIAGNNQNVTGIGDFSVNGNTTLGDAITDNITFTGRANSSLLPIANNTYDLGSSALKWANIYATSFIQNGFNVCDSSGSNCPAGAGYWSLLGEQLYPSNQSYDVFVGGNSTASAKFQAYGIENAGGNIAKLNSTAITTGNVLEATSSAITSGNLLKLGTGGDGHSFSGNAIFADLDNAGGGNFTGNFLRFDNSQATVFTVNSAGNVVTSGDIAVNGGDITSSGALNITPGGTLTAGATGQATVLQGSTTSLTSNGAGNDITLTSADQIILNAGGTIELQDNTNVTGNLDVSGTLTSGTADAFQIDASGNLSSTGTTGITLTGAGSGLTFSTGAGNHDITASAGTLRLGAFTLLGTVTGNNQDVTGIGNLTVNGNTTLGDAITDNITFTGRVAQDSDLLPITTTGTNDIGSGALPWDNIYSNAFIQNGFNVCDASGSNCPAGAGYWSLSNQQLYPSNQTYDVMVGGNSTASAKFQAYGIENANGGIAKLNSSVITTGNVLEATASAITSGNLLKLGTGGDGHSFSGNAIFADLDNAGGGNFTGNFVRFDNSTTTVFTVDSTGNITGAGATGLTLSGTASDIVFSGSGIHEISAANSASNLRVDSGNSAVLQLQNLSAGDVEIAGGSSATGCTITNATGNLTCAGDVAVNGGDLTTSQTTANLFTNATTLGIGGASGTTTINNSLAVNGATLSTDETTFNLINATATTINFAGAATTLNIGPTGSATTSIVMSGGSADTGCTLEGANGNLTCSGNIASTATSGTQGWWQLTNKILSPANSTYDLTIGSNATGAAFQVFGIEKAAGDIAKINSTAITTGDVFEATSSAITSGNLLKLGEAGPQNFTGNGIFMDFDNTGGGSFTGNFIYATNALATMFVVDASGNVTANGDVAVNGGDLTTTTSTATLFNTTATTLNIGGAASTAINLGPTGASGSVAISGGSADTGCTLDGTTGNFTCSGNITSTATTGTQGWWQLTNKILSPANSTYDLTIGSNATGAAFQVFGVEKAAGDIAKLNSTVITTGNVLEATASAITTGNILKLGTGGNGHAFSGNVLLADIDNSGGGNFTGNFIKLNNESATKFLIDSTGSTSIGVGVPLQKLTVEQDAIGDIFGLYDGANNVNLLIADAGVTTFKPSAFDFVYNFDGVATFTNNTTEAKNNGGTPFTMLATENPSNDIFYVGLDHKFATLNVDLATAGAGVTLVKEYWNGSTWTTLTVTDNTTNLTVDGTITFTAPSDWTTTSINSQTKYWVRFCSKSVGGCTGGTGTNVTSGPTANFVTPTTGSRFYAYGQSGDTNPALYINDNGYVGIGTTAPGYALDIISDADFRLAGTGRTDGITLQHTSVGNYLNSSIGTGSYTINSLGGGLILQSGTSSDDLSLYTGDTSSARVTVIGGAGADLGFVGIGDTSPSVQLNVGTANTTHSLGASDALISDSLEVDGAFYLDGKTIYNTNGTASVILCTGASGASCATTSASQNTLSAGVWIVDNQTNVGEPALAINNAKGGDLLVASASGVLQFRVANNGDVFLGNNAGTDLTVGGGTGKIDAGTVDPPYTINGKKYATFLTGIIGVKEEVVGTASTNEYIPGVGYRTVVDFTNLPEGSDLWLFGKATNMNENIGQLVALLTPSFPTKVWYEVDQENKRIMMYSARPAEISYRLTGPRFDAQNWSNRRDEDSETVGFVINNPDFVNTFIENINVTKLADFVTEKVTDGADVASYVLKDTSGQIVDGIESIGNFVAANIKAGMITTSELATTSFTSVQGTVDNLLVSAGLITPDIKTKLISPLANETDVTVQIGNESTDSGKLAITNAEGSEVVSIDTQGDATFSGEIYARNIHSDNLDAIHNILTQVQTDQALLAEAAGWNTSTSTVSATFNELAVSDLYVTNQAAVNSLSVTLTATIGNDLVLGNGTIDTLSGPLKIQELALAPVEIMGGLVNIDTNGNVQIAGNLDVAGTVSTKTLAVKGIDGIDVSTIDASGSATFNTVSVNQVIIAGAQDATNSAVVNGEINTNSTVGKAIVPANVTEITIRNPKVNDYTFVYITPTSSTLNNVLYVKEKSQGYFKVGFTEAISQDTNFNWWIVEAGQ